VRDARRRAAWRPATRAADCWLLVDGCARRSVAINGAAVGAGLCLAIATDMRVASRSAKLSFNFARLGLHPGLAATHFLAQLIGPQAAARLLYVRAPRLVVPSRSKTIELHVSLSREADGRLY